MLIHSFPLFLGFFCFSEDRLRTIFPLATDTFSSPLKFYLSIVPIQCYISFRCTRSDLTGLHIMQCSPQVHWSLSFMVIGSIIKLWSSPFLVFRVTFHGQSSLPCSSQTRTSSLRPWLELLLHTPEYLHIYFMGGIFYLILFLF